MVVLANAASVRANVHNEGGVEHKNYLLRTHDGASRNANSCINYWQFLLTTVLLHIQSNLKRTLLHMSPSHARAKSAALVTTTAPTITTRDWLISILCFQPTLLSQPRTGACHATLQPSGFITLRIALLHTLIHLAKYLLHTYYWDWIKLQFPEKMLFTFSSYFLLNSQK